MRMLTNKQTNTFGQKCTMIWKEVAKLFKQSHPYQIFKKGGYIYITSGIGGILWLQ